MTNYVQKPHDEIFLLRNHQNGRSNGSFSVRSLSKIVSSGASNLASSVRKTGASIVSSIANSQDYSAHDQVNAYRLLTF